MRNFTLLFIFLLVGGLFGTANAQGGAGIVNSCGRLQVKNAHVCSENGTQISLGGMSMFWSGWASKYYNASTVNYLVDNFKTSVVRAAYGCPEATGPQNDIQDIKNVVEAAIAKGVYVIIDWHIEGNNTSYEAQEIAFFESMVQLYGKNNNVLYELWNEPTSSSTSTIQGVCQRVANAIRAKETQLGYTHKLVICGSNTWSQYPNSYSITDPNAAYTFHGYFDNEPSHLTQLYNNAKAAMDMGNAVFVTEYGANYCTNTNTTSAIKWCQDNGISMCAWSVNDKVEAWSIFTNNMDALTCIGNFYKGKLTTWPTPIFTKIYPTSVSITPATVTIQTIGGTTTLSKSFLPANTTEKTATWSSSNAAIAKVSTTGVVTGVALGTVTITVTSKNVNGANITGTSSVTVKNTASVALNSVSIATSAAVGVGATSTLTVTFTPSNATNKNVSWTSSNTAIATVSASGVVTGKAAGTANVTVKSADGNFTDVCVVTVTAATCPTWKANTNYAIGSVVVYNGQNFTSNNDWNGTAGDPYTATHSNSGWGWVIGGTCNKSGVVSSEAVVASVSIYPNPVENEIHVQSSVSNINEVSIYSLTGSLIQKIVLSSVGDFSVNVSDLFSGVYVIKVLTSTETINHKFIKK